MKKFILITTLVFSTIGYADQIRNYKNDVDTLEIPLPETDLKGLSNTRIFHLFRAAREGNTLPLQLEVFGPNNKHCYLKESLSKSNHLSINSDCEYDYDELVAGRAISRAANSMIKKGIAEPYSVLNYEELAKSARDIYREISSR